MITLTRVTKTFDREGDVPLSILRDVSVTFEKGACVAIVGPSGSGKSTLLGLIAGLDVPTSGTVEVDGANLTKMTVEQTTRFRGRRMGFVFQAFHLIPSLTALENVMVPLEIGRHKHPRPIAERLLDRVGLGERLDHRPAHLSGGEQQRVAIARALAPEPALLLVDEPTGSLDLHTGDAIADLLFEVCEEARLTMVMVTHMPSLAARTDRTYELVDGALRIAKEARNVK